MTRMSLGLVLCVAWLWSSTAFAQASGVSVLVTEVVRDASETPTPEVHFWWSSAKDPEFTGSDAVLQAELKARGVTVSGPKEGLKISKIYRLPNLTEPNARSLGSLWGAARVVVGQMRYQELPRVLPFAAVGVRAQATVALLDVRTGRREELALERVVYAETMSGAMERARGVLGRALARALSFSLKASRGPVGVAGSERVLMLRGVGQGRVLTTVRQALLGLDAVKNVGVRWSSEGIIALEVNPGTADSEDTIEEAARALLQGKFASFRVVRAAVPSALGPSLTITSTTIESP